MTARFAISPLALAISLTSLTSLAVCTAQADTLAIQLEPIDISASSMEQPSEVSGSYTVQRSATATRLNLSLQETPQTINVTTRTQMDDFRLDDINAVLEQVNGVQVSRVETDRSYYTARGFDITNFQLDGIGLPLVYGNMYGDMDTALFDRVEVLKGANGLLGGSGSPAATVNFVRKRPTQTPQAIVQISSGSWSNHRLDVDLAGPIADNARGRLVLAGQDKQSWLDRYHQRRAVGYGVVEVDLTATTELTLGHTYQDVRSDSPLWGALPLFYSDGSRTDYSRSDSSATDWAFWNNRSQRSFLELVQQLGQGWQVALNYSHNRDSAESEVFYVYGAPDKETQQGVFSYPSRYHFENRQNLVDLSVNGPFHLGGHSHKLIVGASWSESKTSDQSMHGDTLGSEVPDLHGWDGRYPKPHFIIDGGGSDWRDTERAVYTALHLNLSDDMRLFTGARVTDFQGRGQSYGGDKHNRHSGVVVPYLGVSYDLTNALTAYASFTEIFTPQVARDINGDRLDPIEGTSTEVGFKASLYQGELQGNLAFFQVEQKNLAEAAGMRPGTNEEYFVAAKGIASQGVELDVSGQLLEGLQTSAGYTYIDIEGPDGRSTRTFIPRHTLKFATVYQVPRLPQLRAGASLNWQNRTEVTMANGSTVTQASYGLLNLMSSYQVNDTFKVQLNVRNVADKKYLASMYWADSGQGYYGEPRNASVTFDWSF